MGAESRLAPDNLDTPCNNTFRKDKRQLVTFDDESELTENQSPPQKNCGHWLPNRSFTHKFVRRYDKHE